LKHEKILWLNEHFNPLP